jgi:hypothetical protein
MSVEATLGVADLMAAGRRGAVSSVGRRGIDWTARQRCGAGDVTHRGSGAGPARARRGARGCGGGTGWRGLHVLGVSRAVLGEGRGELGLGWGSRRDARPRGVTRRARGRAQGCGTEGGRGDEGKGRKEKEE